MLLIIEALLLISAVLGQDHITAVEEQIFPLDMALDSVDDQYDGCRENMTHLVQTKYLEKETNNSAEFKKAWQEGEENATAPGDNLTKDHSIAIYVYTNLNSSVYNSFDMALRNGKQNYTNQTFKWYSLHFLLTDAIQILTKTQRKCKSTFRGTKIEFDKNVTGEEVRFGSFTSSSLIRKVAQGFGSKSCFEIKTCESANVMKYSKYPEQKEVLIPPYETFKVTAVKRRGEQKNLWCETVYELESSGTRSDLNCAVAQKSTRFFENTATNTTLRFCRCLHQKIQTNSLSVSQGHHRSMHLWRYKTIGHHRALLNQLRKLNPSDIYLQCLNVSEVFFSQKIVNRRHCYRVLCSLKFDRMILELLIPCCIALI